MRTRPKIEDHMLIVMDKSTHEENLSKPLQTKNKQFKIAVTFPTGNNEIFIVTIEIFKLFFAKSFADDEFSKISIPPGA